MAIRPQRLRMMDLFKFHDNLGLSRMMLLPAVFAVMLLGRSSAEAADDHGNEGGATVVSGHGAEAEGGAHVQTLDGLRQTMEKLIDQAYSESRFFFCSDLIRLYVKGFSTSDKNDLYLSDLREIKNKLLARGRESLAKANSADQRLTAFYLSRKTPGHSGDVAGQALESEAKRLAGGDETLARSLLKKHEATLAMYLDAALYLTAHCLIFPNSADSHRQLSDAAKSAEIAGLPLLEIELRSRLMEREDGTPVFPDTRQLSEKATRQNRFFIAISVLDHFLAKNYSHPKAGHGYLASGDIHQLAGCYGVAASKYNQALLWCGDMEKISHSQSSEADLLRQDVAGIRKRASLSIGYAILAEARGKHLRESTAAFAGKLHDQAVSHFDRLVASVESGSLSSLDYLLGQIRSRAESARYKRTHSSVLGLDEIQDAYANCIPPCEIYLRVLNQAAAEGAALSASNDEDRDEVAFLLLESLLAIGKAEEGEAQFFRYFIQSEGGASSKWAVLAKTRIAKRLVDDGDYLTAYPLLSEIVRDAQKSGLRDVGFTAAVMMGVCVSKLNPAAASNGLLQREGSSETRVSGAQMARDAYSSALAILRSPSFPDSVHYPDEFRDIFLENIREELVAEYRSEMESLQSGWDPLRTQGRGTLLVDALSNLDPAKYPFNPDSLLVTAFLSAQRELNRQSVPAPKEITQNAEFSHK